MDTMCTINIAPPVFVGLTRAMTFTGLSRWLAGLFAERVDYIVRAIGLARR